ncbi:MAG: uridine kinase family protein [Lachnospiraceae bacterium]
MQFITESILYKIYALSQKQSRLLVAIDGRCGAGKTTLASQLQEACGCNVIHMDHFFLRLKQRTADRLKEPGGNVDYERFQKEVLTPLRKGIDFAYRPYDCHKQEFGETIRIEPQPINVIEGSYCCHPALIEYYDFKIFLTVDEAEQLRRIKHRNGRIGAKQFQEKWIPLEEHYFSTYHTKERCDLCFQTVQCSWYD